jgi:RHS repeat-associated protein
LGSIASLTGGSGQLANSYVYDSFGNLTASTGTLTNPFQYTGREFDSETGLYYYRARYYDATSGRFLSEDSLGHQAGVNFYSYVENSPVNLLDPSGNYARLNPNSNCAEVFSKALHMGLCPGDFADFFNKTAAAVPIYTVRSPQSPASNLTQDAVSRNGSSTTLGSTFFNNINPPNAFRPIGGSRQVIVLGPGYFAEPYNDRVATLIHEEFHAVTGLSDADVFNLFAQYGLSRTEFDLWPHPTNEFSKWIENGCLPGGSD